MKTIKASRKLKTLGATALSAALLLTLGWNAVFSPAMKVASASTNTRTEFYPDHDSFEECLEESRNLVKEIADDAMVLLKNKDNALPLTDAKNISVFGVRSQSTFVTGGGSGSGPNVDENIVPLKNALQDAGYKVNPQLSGFYDRMLATGEYGDISEATGEDNYALEVPLSAYSDQLRKSYADYKDAALIVISRMGSEGGDLYQGQLDANGNKVKKHYLELTKNEQDLLDHVKASGFKKVVVLLNTASTFECGSMQADDKIDGILFMGLPGVNGTRTVADILKGNVNPSGRTADIYSKDFTKDPTYYNFADNSQTGGGATYTWNGEATSLNYVEYEEGIYSGYRYYETRGEVEGGSWYDNNVVYPFGYGLSYTTFDWEVKSISGVDTVFGATSKLTGREKITVTVEVTNTGDVAGKDVVELYVKAPYTGKIEKSSVVLAGFAKTDVIAAHSSQTVTVEAQVLDFASFDQSKAVLTNGGYVLEAGTYTLSLQSDSHNVKDSEEYTLENDITVGNSSILFSNDDKYNSTLNGMEAMSRSDFEGTFPKAPTATELELSNTETGKKIYEIANTAFVSGGTEDEEDEIWYGYYKTMYDEHKNVWTQDAAKTIDFQEMVGVDKNDAKWDKFINQLSITELKQVINGQSYYTLGIDELGIPEGSHGDGPCCIYNWHTREQGTTWPSPFTVASTWNVELAEKQGVQIGNEGMWLDVDGWYAPATDGHRSNFGGRNFEYYSEDGVLAGWISGYTIKGAQSKGLICFIKHFAVNEQEWNRQNLVTWVDEQTIREVYTKSFRIAIEIGNPYALMSAMNRIGIIGIDNNFPFLTSLLRGEFGFDGFITSDMIMNMTTTGLVDNIDLFNRSGMDIALTLTAASMIGQDPMLATGEWDATGKYMTCNGQRNDVAYAAIRNCVKNILFSVAQSNAMKNGVSLDSYTAKDLKASVGNPFSASVAADAAKLGTEIVKYTLAAGSSLPEGLTLDETTGTISGIPAAAGNYSFDITIIADGFIDKTETITIAIDNGIFAVDKTAAVAGTEFTAKISTEGVESQKYTYLAGELPAGIRVLEDGTISGTAVTPGTYTFNVYASVVTIDFCGAPWLMLPVEHNYVLEITLNVAEELVVVDTTVADLSAKVDGIASDVEELEKNAEESGSLAKAGFACAALALVGVAAVVAVGVAKRKHN